MIYSQRCCVCAWEEDILYCCWVACSLYICWIHLFYSVIQICLLTDFLSGFISIFESEVLKPPTSNVLLRIVPISYVNVCFTYLGALMMDAYTFIIIIQLPDELTSVIITQWPSLSPVTVFGLTFLLSSVSMCSCRRGKL